MILGTAYVLCFVCVRVESHTKKLHKQVHMSRSIYYINKIILTIFVSILSQRGIFRRTQPKVVCSFFLFSEFHKLYKQQCNGSESFQYSNLDSKGTFTNSDPYTQQIYFLLNLIKIQYLSPNIFFMIFVKKRLGQCHSFGNLPNQVVQYRMQSFLHG